MNEVKIEVGQVWRHKRRGQLLKVEAVGDDEVTLREVERSSTSPPEGTVYKMSVMMLTILWSLQHVGRN